MHRFIPAVLLLECILGRVEGGYHVSREDPILNTPVLAGIFTTDHSKLLQYELGPNSGLQTVSVVVFLGCLLISIVTLLWCAANKLVRLASRRKVKKVRKQRVPLFKSPIKFMQSAGEVDSDVETGASSPHSVAN